MSEATQAPAGQSSAPSYVTPTNGMSESQIAAAHFIDTNRAAAAKDVANCGPGSLNARMKEAARHAFHGEPVPAWLVGKTDAQKVADARPADESAPELARFYQPISEEEAVQVRTSAKVYGVPPAEADALADFCAKAQIPATQADGIARRLAHHVAQGGSMAPLSAEEQAEFYQEAARSFGGEEKLLEVNAKARKYIESLAPEVVRYVDEKIAGTSIAYDPRVLIALASLADARGIK